jgi:hypothetical protein
MCEYARRVEANLTAIRQPHLTIHPYTHEGCRFVPHGGTTFFRAAGVAELSPLIRLFDYQQFLFGDDCQRPAGTPTKNGSCRGSSANGKVCVKSRSFEQQHDRHKCGG